MSGQISVIIPTLNAAGALGPCLAALKEGIACGLVAEVILSDGGSTDETLSLTGDAKHISGPAGRGGQLRRGAAASTCPWLLFLHADSWLTPGWACAVQDHITTHETAAAFRLRFRANGPGATCVAGWANLRSRIFRLPYGDQGLLISRPLYDMVGGFADIPLMEDVAMAKNLRQFGPTRLLPSHVTTGANRYLAEGWIRRGARNLVLLLRYFCGADPNDLARSYRDKKHRH